MDKIYSVSEAARELNVPPRDITAIFYEKRIPDSAGPIIGDRRIIPATSLPLIEKALHERRQRAGKRRRVPTVLP